jgi:hypothetical protein
MNDLDLRVVMINASEAEIDDDLFRDFADIPAWRRTDRCRTTPGLADSCGQTPAPRHVRFAPTASTANTTSGCRRSIIWSSRARKKSSVIAFLWLDFSQVLAAIILISGRSQR